MRLQKRLLASIKRFGQRLDKRFSGCYINDDNIIGISNPNSCISGSSILDADDILFEILSRLPGKSLIRFKCVCKRWWFLIVQDQLFHDLHLTRSKIRPCLLITIPLMRRARLDASGSPPRLNVDCFLSLDLLLEGKAATGFHNIGTMRKTWNRDVITNPVNGLICLIDLSVFGVRIYNHCTNEITPPILSIFLSTFNEENGYKGVRQSLIISGFGFDPAIKEHKVICVWRISTSFPYVDYVVCEILTLGHKSWRWIPEFPPCNSLEGSVVYVNGSIYWRNFKSLNDNKGVPAAIVAFDVGREKFRVIPIPKFILHTSNCDKYFDWLVFLLEIDGRVALLHRVNGYIFKLWIFDDVYDIENRTTSTGGGNRRSKWVEETITLPIYWDKTWVHRYFHAVAGTDQLILESYGSAPKHLKYVSLYSYNRKKKTFTKLEIKDIPSIPDHCCSYSIFTTSVESLLPVQKSEEPCPST